MKSLRIRLFIKPYCGWCRQAVSWLNQHGLKYETLDVIADRQAHQEMVRLSQQTLAPVIEVNGHVLADFGVPELEIWWQQQGFDAA